jgi:excisionase family DNA binding protein
MSMNNPDFVSRPAAATLLGVRLETINTIIKMGQVPTVKIGRRVYIPRSSIAELLTAKYAVQAAA